MTDLHTWLDSLRDRRVAALGVGVSNRPLVRLLCEHGVRVTVYDRKTEPALGAAAQELRALGAELVLGEDYLDRLEGDVVFRSPGFRPDIPALERVRAAGGTVTSEMEAFFEVCPCRIVGVTGSDGKTTTTTLIARMLTQAGKRVWLGGNIGRPLLAHAGEMLPDDVCVLELSSFQLMTMRRSPSVSVVTNLSPNHLDWHTDFDEYVQAKTNLFAWQDARGVAVLNADDPLTAALAAPGQKRFFSLERQPEDGTWLRRDGMLCDTVRGALVPEADIRLPGRH
ncbi:MAG: UDP-N-acetylmuramoyl-L-alanine--D-glutamate ligase, partial [Butyricicoccus sp.]|nr:UDP-N-acetylmuramoyl-L-alanine--D-glutamate ligase [Butyricicoccus sp.]